LGIGLGASSCINDVRSSNVSDMDRYLSGDYRGEEQVLSDKDKMEEFMFLGLRLTEGISPEVFADTFGTEIDVIYGDILEKLIREKLIIRNERIKLTHLGLDISNYVFSQFLLD